MNFQQLRIVRETVRRNFNLTEVAAALYTSQSGVSKHIKDLEDELGVELFVRKGKRFLGLTDPGRELVEIASRILLDANTIRSIGEHFSSRDQGELTVATTHTQARYMLPKIIPRFREQFPRVHLVLHQGSPDECVSLLLNGDADIGIATESVGDTQGLISFEFYEWHHAVIVPRGHPLDTAAPLSLERLVEYPILTYHEGFTGRQRVDDTFAHAGLKPDVVMSALDADVIKTYVLLGLGIGIVASMAFDPVRDTDLRMLAGAALFGTNTTRIAIRRGAYLRGFAYQFLELCSGELTEQRVRTALNTGQNGD
jgi:LysR family transcriptional regulator, cys regulon transcriptional activator